MINLKSNNKITNPIFQNIMFIGDPHVSSKKMSTRHDGLTILDTIINKLSQAAKISHEKKAYTIITGDLLDDDKENNIILLNKLITVLQEFYYPPLTVIGNHEKTENVINEKNMITALINTGTIQEVQDNKMSVVLNIDDDIIYIGGTNYISTIPNKITRPKDADYVLWVTHHDLMFENYYPGSQPLKEISGVDLAINGHIHDTKPQVQTKMTTWWNTGNIFRQRINMKDHVPSIWLWNPEHHQKSKNKLIQVPLDYNKDVFINHETIEATIKPDYDTKNTDTILNNSDKKFQFIELIDNAVANQENNKTSDKELFKEHMANLAKLQQIPDDITEELFNMLQETELD